MALQPHTIPAVQNTGPEVLTGGCCPGCWPGHAITRLVTVAGMRSSQRYPWTKGMYYCWIRETCLVLWAVCDIGLWQVELNFSVRELLRSKGHVSHSGMKWPPGITTSIPAAHHGGIAINNQNTARRCYAVQAGTGDSCPSCMMQAECPPPRLSPYACCLVVSTALTLLFCQRSCLLGCSAMFSQHIPPFDGSFVHVLLINVSLLINDLFVSLLCP